MMSKNSQVTTYEKGGNSLNPFIKIFVFLIVLGLFVIPASAFDDSVQRYITSYTEVWASATGGTASPPSSVSIANIPTAYPTAKSIKLRGAGSGSSGGWAYIQSKENLSFNYIGFTIQDYTSSLSPTFKIMYINGSTDGVIRESSFAVADLNAGDRWELLKSGGNILLYINGVYDSNLGAVPDSEGKIKFYVSGVISSPPYSVLTLYLDDFSTSSIIGMDEQWTQADTNIDTSYGIQSQSSFPTDEYTIKVTRPSTSETINTTSLGTGTTGDESGFVRWNRNDIFGSNFGLYQATLYRESDVLTNTYFSIFDTTIQGSVDWEENSYTIDQTPAIEYLIENGDLSVYIYTLRVIDSLQQIKESYTLNSYSGIKSPNLAGYSTGTYYAVLSRKNKATSKVDDFAFDTVEISAEGVSPSSYINFGLDQYIIGDTASYTFNWADDDTSFWTRERIVIEKDGVILDRINAELSGTRYLDMDELGRYSISLISYGLLTYSNPVIHASDGVECIEPLDSYINVPQTAYTAESFAISYLYGRTPLGPFLKISKQIPSESGDYTYVDVDADYLKDQDIVAGTVYTPDLTIFESGTYLIGIYDINLLAESRSMLIASDTIKIFYQDAISRINITESKIDTSNVTTIGLGDTLFGNYQVDSLNYTTGPIRLEMYNYENDVLSFSMPKQAQKGSYELPIKNLEYFVEVKDGHETVYKVDALFYTGNNQVRLTRYDPDGTYNQTLAYTNVTIDYVNSAGYSLTLSKYMVVQNEPFTISVKCPTTSRLVIFDDTGYAIDNINLSGNVNIPYSLSSGGKYSIQLYDPSTNLQCIELITVNEGVRPEIEEEEPTQSTIDMVIMFLSMPAFWGMVIWVGVVGGAAQKVSGNSTGYIAFLFANILAVIGLFAPYTIYIVLITWIAAGIFFKLGRDAAGGE